MKKLFLASILFITITLSWFNVVNCQIEAKFEKIIEFSNNQVGYATLTNSDLLILNLSSEESKQWVEWNQRGKTLKKINNAGGCVYSPDGKYYAYLNLNDNIIYINNNNDKTVAIFKGDKYGANFVWAYNSKYLFIRISENNTGVIYKYNILEKTSEKILKSNIYFAPVSVKNENIIYLLKNKTPDAPDTDCDIVRYNLLSKKFETISFPSIHKLWIFDNYTVSPNGKIVIFQNCNEEDSAMYVINLENSKVIERIPLSSGSQIANFSWKPDSSYFVFTTDMKAIYKYIIPKY